MSLSATFVLTAGSLAQNQTFTLDELIPGGAHYASFVPENIYGLQWWGDVCMKPDIDKLISVNPANKKETIIATLDQVNKSLKEQNLGQIRHFYSVSFPYADKKIMKIDMPQKSIFYDFDKNNVASVVTTKEKAANNDFCKENGAVAYTIDNNLYVTNSKGENINVTNEPQGVVCGQSVHRNEFGINKGTFWSPKGNFLAFYRMDERMVADYPFENIDSRIETINPGKYPMAGMTSHEVTIGIYNMATGKIIYLNAGNPKDRYFTNIAWAPDEKSIYFIELNRDQNHSQLFKYNVATGKKEKMLIEETNPKYVEPQHPIVFLKGDDSKFIYQSQRDGFNHLYLYDINGKMIKQLTSGNWLVKDILGFDAKGDNLYISSTEGSPLEQHIYMVNIKSGKRTCLTKAIGTHNSLLSASGKYLIDRYTSTAVPRCIDIIDVNKLKSTNLLTAANPYDGYKTPEIEMGKIKADDGITDLYYRLIKPVDFDPAKKYPTVIYVYGGPHAQVVNNTWLGGARGWEIYMASKGYVMFSIDNRGSENRGLEFEQATFRQLGVVESKDQMKGVEFLKSLPFVDANRIGVHGWSFGGFMTTNLMLRYPDTFKVGVAGGPVIDWNLYEVMYGERYMDSPESNPEGYKECNMKLKAGNLKGHLLMIHGGIDPTCVPQHTFSFIKACVDAGTYPDLFIYPGHEHGVVGKDRVHLNVKMTQYFDNFLK